MHGVDWEAMLQKYLPLVDRVSTRDELAELFGLREVAQAAPVRLAFNV